MIKDNKAKEKKAKQSEEIIVNLNKVKSERVLRKRPINNAIVLNMLPEPVV